MDIAKDIRRRIVDIGFRCGQKGIHFGGILSLVEIMLAIYSESVFDKKNDRVVLSKGHGALAQYLVMEHYGLLKKGEVDKYKEDFALCSVHPSRSSGTGIDYSSGSLGQGLSLGCGIALAKNNKNQAGKVYVVLGDGECDEGSVWESIMFASQMGLDNIIAIIDANEFQYDGATKEIIDLSNLAMKISAFGWKTYDVNGHNINEIMEAILEKDYVPKAIVAHTIKGKGISFMEGDATWHNRNLTQEQYKVAMEEL